MYHQFAGRDAARAYVTGCFKIHLTHDIRGFGEKEMKVCSLLVHPCALSIYDTEPRRPLSTQDFNKWKKFYAEHKKYKKVGKVYHHAIDPNSPLPPPCDSKGNAILDVPEVTDGPQATPPPAAEAKIEEARATGKQEL